MPVNRTVHVDQFIVVSEWPVQKPGGSVANLTLEKLLL